MELEQKRELAFLYLQDALEADEKFTVFDLILNDAEFRQCLKEELEFKKQIQQLQPAMESSIKIRLLNDIKYRLDTEKVNTSTNKSASPAWLPWSEFALRMTLPPIIYPVMKTLQRRLFT